MRPLAAVMVGDPTPLTQANLGRLATWCDLLLIEGDRTFQGEPRIPLRAGWRNLLNLEPPQLRVLTIEFPPSSAPMARFLQRSGVLPMLSNEPSDRPVLLLDSDEILDRKRVESRIATGIKRPIALPLVPLYGAIDREAISLHCCWKPPRSTLRFQPPPRRYAFAGPSLATVGMVLAASPPDLRQKAPVESGDHTYGLHLTMADPVERVLRKLRSNWHRWDPRIINARHLETMLSAGIHHAGWWVASYREPEPWLRQLAQDCELRIAGPSLPPSHLRALRAWAEARLDPALPERLVHCGDTYVAMRPVEAEDDLNSLDTLQCQRPMRHWGHVEEHLAVKEHNLSDDWVSRVRTAT